LLAIILFGTVGRLLVSKEGMKLGARDFAAPPSRENPLGTDTAGRSVLVMMIYGTLPTLTIGLIAGGIGTVVGTSLGLMAGYYGGPIDTILRTSADVLLGVPSLMVLVVLASYLGDMSIVTMSAIIAFFAWPWPARSVRSQTLSMRELAYVEMAKLSGCSNLEIIFMELMPNLLPYIASSFVRAVSGGIMASVGLQMLGLGSLTLITLALMLSNAFSSAALTRGLWWWWLPSTVVLTLLFVGLFLVTLSLDEAANPRLKAARRA
jgi:peptide/nickel transport system permease protein